MSQVKFRVCGDERTFDFDELNIVDADDLRASASAQIAYWGTVVADVQEELDKLENELVNWTGTAMGLAQKAEGGSAEWKVKAAVAAQPVCRQKNDKIASKRRDLNVAKAILTGYQKQHDMLRSISDTPPSRVGDIGRTEDDRMSAFRNKRRQQREQAGQTQE